MKNISRRKFIHFSLFFNSLALWPKTLLANKNLASTPAEIAGPFYPVVAQKDTDFDLTKIVGHTKTAVGHVIMIHGRIIDKHGKALEDAKIELWQANAAGRYRHKHDSNPAPVDPNFQGWAIVDSGVNGDFIFKTILPGAYPASKDWLRPPHIHFKISKKGFKELTTQMYFDEHELNNTDLLLSRKTSAQQTRMTAKQSPKNKNQYNYEIILN